MTISLRRLFLMPEASFALCEGYLQSLQFPILMARRLILALMNHHVSCWFTSIDPNDCFIFKTHLQHYISGRRFLVLLITPSLFHVDLLRGIAKCTLGSYQLKLFQESVLFIELTATLMEPEWSGDQCDLSEWWVLLIWREEPSTT